MLAAIPAGGIDDMHERRLEFLRNPDARVLSQEVELSERIVALRNSFLELYQEEPEVYVRSPGRAEILGNHTDYNLGFALSCAISRSTLVALRKRSDSRVCIHSSAFPGSKGSFELGNLHRDREILWPNYAKAVVSELLNAGHELSGSDIFVESTVPFSGGVSSSAALEVGLAAGFKALFDLSIDQLELALLCRRAENGPLVGAPCGLLDQASVAFAETSRFVRLDFRPTANAPVGVELISADLAARGFSFVITVDPQVKRNLGESGYPARRKMCEASCPILSDLLGRKVDSLRDVGIEEFETCKSELVSRGGDIMAHRVQHVVYENQRVLDGVQALRKGEAGAFGAILTLSGHSALELYGLDENTPELTYLVELGRRAQGCIGTRNMGGGFSAISLSLVEQDAIPDFEQELASKYQARFGQSLEFIEFEPACGVTIL